MRRASKFVRFKFDSGRKFENPSRLGYAVTNAVIRHNDFKIVTKGGGGWRNLPVSVPIYRQKKEKRKKRRNRNPNTTHVDVAVSRVYRALR